MCNALISLKALRPPSNAAEQLTPSHRLHGQLYNGYASAQAALYASRAITDTASGRVLVDITLSGADKKNEKAANTAQTVHHGAPLALANNPYLVRFTHFRGSRQHRTPLGDADAHAQGCR